MSFLDPGVALYVAAGVALVVWLALFGYLWTIDRHTRELRKKLEERAELRDQRRQAPPLQPVRNPRTGAAEGSHDQV